MIIFQISSMTTMNAVEVFLIENSLANNLLVAIIETQAKYNMYDQLITY